MLLFALFACTWPGKSVDSGEAADSGGVDAIEVCNGRDDDGDGLVDEDLLMSGYVDGDGDGAGADASAWEACEAPAGAVTEGGDCDDADAAVHPDAVESCATPGDDDCDGVANADGAEGCTDVWADEDGDGLGGGASSCVCEPGEGPRSDDDCDPVDVDRGLDCTEGAVVPLDGARVLEDDDEVAWTLVGAADLDGARGDELVLSATAGLALLTLPGGDAGDTFASEALLGSVPLTNYSDRALRPGDDTGETALVEASYTAVPDSDAPEEAFHTISPTLRGYRAPLADAAPAWTWDLAPLHTSYVQESLFLADVDGDGIVEAWYASGTTPANTGEAALWRVSDSGVTEVLRTTQPGALYHVAPLGDPDGDGVADLGVLTAGADGDTVSVYAGPVVDALPTPSADIATDELYDLVALGDLDGDGYDDIALRGQRVHVLRGPLESGDAAVLAATRVGPESDDVDESALFVTAGDVSADGTREFVVTDTYWPGRIGGEPLRGAVYVFEGLPTGVVDVRAATTRVYGTDYGALGAYPTVLEDGRLLVGAHLEDHVAGRGVFWLLGL